MNLSTVAFTSVKGVMAPFIPEIISAMVPTAEERSLRERFDDCSVCLGYATKIRRGTHVVFLDKRKVTGKSGLEIRAESICHC
jgi:hypothetical protein